MIAITVHTGDTMSAIAAAHAVPLSSLEAANPQVRDPNRIFAGETLNLPSGRSVTITSHGDGDHDGDDGFAGPPESSASPSSVPQSKNLGSRPSGNYSAPNTQPQSSAGSAAVPSWAKCIVYRESSNNPRAVNSIPGYVGNGGGLFGDLTSTWNNYGGYHQPFEAPVSVQIAFNNQLHAQMGLSPWAADHCPGT